MSTDACLVVDALEPSVREELVKNFCDRELISYQQIFEGAGHNLRKQGQAGDKTAATRAANNTGVSLESSRTNRGKIVRKNSIKERHQGSTEANKTAGSRASKNSWDNLEISLTNRGKNIELLNPQLHCIYHLSLPIVNYLVWSRDYWSMQSEKRPVRVWPGGLYLIRSCRHPTLKWAQRDDLVYITIDLPDAKNVNLKLTQEGKFYFSAISGPDSTPYEIDINLYDNGNVDESKANVGSRNVVYIVKKEESKWWNRLMKQEGRTLAFVKVDWNKWVDEDEQDEKAGPDMEYDDVNFSSLNLGGGGGEDFDADDDDDDDEKESDTEEDVEEEIESSKQETKA
ncbi:hypothetical protein LXL04_003726 [Taraxacum kok-saghyz]